MMKKDLPRGPIKTKIFLTHTHPDHIMGFPFFTPIFIPGTEINVYGPVTYEEDTLDRIVGVGCQEHITLRSIFRAGQDRNFLSFTLLCLLLFLAMGQMSTTLSVYTVVRAGFSDAMYGSLLTLNGLMVVALQYPITRLAQRFTKKTALILGSCFYAVGYFSMSMVGLYPVALAAMAVVTLGEMTIAPTTLGVVGEMSPPTWRGRYMGFYGLSETIGVSAGPLLGGILLDDFPKGRASIWGVIAGAALLAAVGYAFWDPYKRFKKRVG